MNGFLEAQLEELRKKREAIDLKIKQRQTVAAEANKIVIEDAVSLRNNKLLEVQKKAAKEFKQNIIVVHKAEKEFQDIKNKIIEKIEAHFPDWLDLFTQKVFKEKLAEDVVINGIDYRQEKINQGVKTLFQEVYERKLDLLDEQEKLYRQQSFLESFASPESQILVPENILEREEVYKVETDVSQNFSSSRPSSAHYKQREETSSQNNSRNGIVLENKTSKLQKQPSHDELSNRSINFLTQASSGGGQNYVSSNLKSTPLYLLSPNKVEILRGSTQGDIPERKTTTTLLDEFVLKDPIIKPPFSEAKSINPLPESQIQPALLSDKNEIKIFTKKKDNDMLAGDLEITNQEIIQRRTLPKVQTVNIQSRSSLDLSGEEQRANMPPSNNGSRGPFWPNENNTGQSVLSSLQNSTTIKKSSANPKKVLNKTEV